MDSKGRWVDNKYIKPIFMEDEGNPLVRPVDGDKPQNSPLEAESLPEDDKRPRR